MSRATQLPYFDHHPVIEVVCGVMFEAFESLLAPRLGLLWDKFRQSGYTRCQGVSPVAPVIEQFEDMQQVQLEFTDTSPLPRIWFVRPDENGIVQVQRDRFLHNWTKVRAEEEYLHYEAVVTMFRDRLASFEASFQDTELSSINPRQADKSLAEQGEEEQTSLLLLSVEELSERASRAPMAEVAPVVRRKVEFQPDDWYPEIDIRSFGNGTIHKDAMKSSESGRKRLYRFLPGDLLFPNLFSWEGAITVVRRQEKGRFASHCFLTGVPDPERGTAQLLCWWLLSTEGVVDIRGASPSAAGRNKTLGIKKLEAIGLPLPLVEQKKGVGELVKQVQRTRITHKKAATFLEDIMPALLDQDFRGELLEVPA